MERPRIVTAALYGTMAMGTMTVMFRIYLALDLSDREDGAAFAFLMCIEGLVVGVLPLVLAALALRPRRSAHVLLAVSYVINFLDALVWVVATPFVAMLIAVLMSSGHGGSSARAEHFLGSAALRWVWVGLKLVLTSGLFYVVMKPARTWREATARDQGAAHTSNER